ncbi:phage tail tape measure protein [Thioclava sp. GXIMD4215]|uniref:phage tail tape measure protein n=1 Tax=Thioclava sp. GXIMD4215 TaxID=3131928 RepID=UPI00324F1208
MASSVIGALRVNLGLDSAQFSRGLNQGRSDLARFAAKAGQLAAGVAASLGSAMSAMGLSAIDAGAEITRLSQVANTMPAQFQGWAAGAKSVGIEQDKLADILKDVNDRVGDFVQTGGGPMADFFETIAPRVGVTADQFRNLSGADALQLYVSTLQKANVNQQDFTFYMEAMASDSTLLLPLLRDGGSAMADFAKRAEEVGAVLDGQTLAALNSGKLALNDMNLAWSGMKNTVGAQMVPALRTLADAVTVAASFFRENAETIMTVLRTMAGTAVASAAIFAGRFAISIGVTAVQAIMSASAAAAAHQIMLGRMTLSSILAANAVRGLALAFTALRGALISTGIGALIVGAGFLIGEFVKLVGAAGSFGEAMKLVGALGAEVWDRIVLAAKAAYAYMSAGAQDLRAMMLDVFAAIMRGGITFANRYIGIYRGAFAAVKAIWQVLPAAIGDFAYSAANRLIEAVEAMINGVVSRINLFIEGLNYVPGLNIAPVAEVDLAGVENPYKDAMRQAGTAAADAFTEGFNTETFDADSVPAALEGMADEARSLAGNTRLAADALTALATTPLQSWKDLQETIRSAKNDAGDAPLMPGADPFAGGSGGDETGASRQARKTKQEVTELQKATDDWKSSWQDGFKGMLFRTKSLGDALSGVLSKLADMLADSAFSLLWGSTGLGKMAGGLLGALGIGANANGTNNWRGGLSYVNERGSEIMNLPRGTQVIPHDVSMRMADAAGRASGGAQRVVVEAVPTDLFDLRVKSVADQSVSQARAGIVSDSVQATGRAMTKSKSFGSR